MLAMASIQVQTVAVPCRSLGPEKRPRKGGYDRVCSMDEPRCLAGGMKRELLRGGRRHTILRGVVLRMPSEWVRDGGCGLDMPF